MVAPPEGAVERPAQNASVGDVGAVLSDLLRQSAANGAPDLTVRFGSRERRDEAGRLAAGLRGLVESVQVTGADALRLLLTVAPVAEPE